MSRFVTRKCGRLCFGSAAGLSELKLSRSFLEVSMLFCADHNGDLLYHDFDTSVVPPAFPNASSGCATVAAAGHWQATACEQPHRVVCQSGRRSLNTYFHLLKQVCVELSVSYLGSQHDATRSRSTHACSCRSISAARAQVATSDRRDRQTDGQPAR